MDLGGNHTSDGFSGQARSHSESQLVISCAEPHFRHEGGSCSLRGMPPVWPGRCQDAFSTQPSAQALNAMLRPLLWAFLGLLCNIKTISWSLAVKKGLGWVSPLMAKILFMYNICC